MPAPYVMLESLGPLALKAMTVLAVLVVFAPLLIAFAAPFIG